MSYILTVILGLLTVAMGCYGHLASLAISSGPICDNGFHWIYIYTQYTNIYVFKYILSIYIYITWQNNQSEAWMWVWVKIVRGLVQKRGTKNDTPWSASKIFYWHQHRSSNSIKQQGQREVSKNCEPPEHPITANTSHFEEGIPLSCRFLMCRKSPQQLRRSSVFQPIKPSETQHCERKEDGIVSSVKIRKTSAPRRKTPTDWQISRLDRLEREAPFG